MPTVNRDVTDAELAVLQVLWDEGPAPIRRLAEVIYPKGGASHYATVQKLLERLEDKGCVERDRGAGVHVFTAAVERDDLIGRQIQTMAAKLCGGSLTPILTHLVKAQRLTAKERQELRTLVESLDRGKVKR